MYRVSVIMPVHNDEHTMEASINSILNQSLYDLELILINDGSTDSTGDICSFYQKKEPLLIRVIHQKRLGFAIARNKGLEMATGKYIYFANANNVFNHRLLQNSLSLAEETNSNLVVFGFKEQNTTNKYSEIIQHLPHLSLISTQSQFRSYYKDFHRFFPYILANKLYNHEYLLNQNLKFQKIPEKEVEFFNLSVYENLNSVTFSQEILCYKRMDSETKSNLSLSNHFILNIEVVKKLEKMFTVWEKDYKDIIAKEFFNIVDKQIIKIISNEFSIQDQKTELKRMLENKDVQLFLETYQLIKKKTPYEKMLCSYMRKGDLKKIMHLTHTKTKISKQTDSLKKFVQLFLSN